MLAKDERGFTLLEVAFSLFIIAVSLMALAKMQTRSILAADYSARLSIATALAQEKIEEFQRTPLVGLANGTDTRTVGAVTGARTVYTRTWTVDAATWGANAREVTVTVNWLNYQVTLRSIIT